MDHDTLLKTLRDDEGWKGHAYQDHLGFWTLGYGFLIDERKGVGLPKPVGEFWLRYAVNERLAELRNRWPAFDRMHEDVQLAVANLAYQIGVSGALNFKKMIAALEAGNRELAATHLLDSKYANQTPARAQRNARLMRGREP